jgi:hypothetical protein
MRGRPETAGLVPRHRGRDFALKIEIDVVGDVVDDLDDPAARLRFRGAGVGSV